MSTSKESQAGADVAPRREVFTADVEKLHQRGQEVEVASEALQLEWSVAGIRLSTEEVIFECLMLAACYGELSRNDYSEIVHLANFVLDEDDNEAC